MNTKLESIKFEVEQELNKLNGKLDEFVAKINGNCTYKNMLTRSADLKVYDVAYEDGEICNRYGITNEDEVMDLFNLFCECEYENMEYTLNSEISRRGYSNDWKDLIKHVGRTSSFQVNPWAADFGTTVDELVAYYVADQLALNYCEHVDVEYSTNHFKILKYDRSDDKYADENEFYEAEEILEELQELNEEISSCDITEDDDFKMCTVVWNYIQDFKQSQLAIFEDNYVVPYAEGLLEDETSELQAKAEDLEQKVLEARWKLRLITDACDQKRETVQDIINLVWSSLDTDNKKKLMDLLRIKRN